MGGHPRTRPDEQGLALIILLVVVLVAGIVGAAMGTLVLDEIEMGQNDNNLVRAQYFAEGALAVGWNELANINPGWNGNISYTYAATGANNGAYQVAVDTTASNSAVKVLVAQGNSSFSLNPNNSTIFPAVAQIRETGLLLPTAFTFSVYSNTSLWVVNGTPNVTVSNLFGPRPNAIGTVFANNIAAPGENASVGVCTGVVLCLTENSQGGLLQIQGGVPATDSNSLHADANPPLTCSQTGNCTPLTTANDTNVAAIAMPQMNWTAGGNNYQGKAIGAGTYFAQNTPTAGLNGAQNFYKYVCTKAAGAAAVTLGTAAAPVTLYINDTTSPTISPVVIDNSNPAGPFFSGNNGCTATINQITINGTLAVYTTGAAGSTAPAGELPGVEVCQVGPPLVPCGDIYFGTMTVTVNAQKGEPAIMVGGNIFGGTPTFPNPTCNAPTGAISGGGGPSPPAVTIKGLVYTLANTANPATAGSQATYGWCVGAGAAGTVNAVVINGALVANAVYEYMGTSITWDPSIFYSGLPSGLVNPAAGQWTVILLSHTSGQ